MNWRHGVLGFTVLLFAAITAAAEGQKPADPLTEAEVAKARKVAERTELQEKRLVAEHYDFVGTELSEDVKVRSEEPPERSSRHALVIFYRSDRGDGLQVLVDLGEGRVLDTAVVSGNAVPLGREEVERAANLALSNSAVRSLLGEDTSRFHVATASSDEDDTIEGLRTLGTGPKDPCSRHRCVDLFVRRHGRYLVGTRISVNLTTGAVTVAKTQR